MLDTGLEVNGYHYGGIEVHGEGVPARLERAGSLESFATENMAGQGAYRAGPGAQNWSRPLTWQFDIVQKRVDVVITARIQPCGDGGDGGIGPAGKGSQLPSHTELRWWSRRHLPAPTRSKAKHRAEPEYR